MDVVPVRSAVGVILGSAALVGVALGGTFVVAEHFIRDELVGAILMPCAVAVVLAITSLAWLGNRGDRATPLRMIGAWALVVPALAAATTALFSLAFERSDYIAHAAVQTAVRSEIAVAAAALVLLRAWLRVRRRP